MLGAGPNLTPFPNSIILRDGHCHNHGRLPARDPIYLAPTPMWRSPTRRVRRTPSTAITLIAAFALSRHLDKTLNVRVCASKSGAGAAVAFTRATLAERSDPDTGFPGTLFGTATGMLKDQTRRYTRLAVPLNSIAFSNGEYSAASRFKAFHNKSPTRDLLHRRYGCSARRYADRSREHDGVARRERKTPHSLWPRSLWWGMLRIGRIHASRGQRRDRCRPLR
jgi:hypothetical protein